MKKTSIKIAALAAAVVLGLAGCGSATPSGTATGVVGAVADVAALNSVAWGTDATGAPALTFKTPLTISAPASKLISEGNGATISAGDVVTFNYVVANGTDGSSLYSTYTSGAVPEVVVLSSTAIEPVFLGAFVGHKVGATLLYGRLSTDSTGATASIPIVVAITIMSATVPLTRAEGTAEAPVAGLPVVTLAADGTPSVAIPATDAPTELVSQPLIKGTGAAITEGQKVIVNYTGWLWNGTQFDTSWGTGAPATMTLATGSLIDGWVQGLAGATVGSQVLLVIPPSLGYGDKVQSTIPAGSTLVFVVDILAAL